MNERPSILNMTVPDFSAEMTGGHGFRLSEHRGKKVVLYFYPKDNTPGCTTENIDFSCLKPEFDKAGVALLGISKDPPKKHQGFIAKHELTAPLASDAESAGLSDALGIWGEKQNYGRTYMGMVRTTYLVDAEGRIDQVWNKVRVKDHAQAVLDAAKAL